MKREELLKIGVGNTAEIFMIDKSRVLKLFKQDYSEEDVLYEYNNHSMVSSIIGYVPKVFECIENNGRFGYIMENIEGQSLASLMQNEQTFEQSVNMFINCHKSWLAQKSGTVILYTDWMKNILNRSEKANDLSGRIERLPEGNTLCHGDFHPYNIIVTSNNKPIIIDFANICRGPREYDIARTYFLLREAGAEKVAGIYLDEMQIEYKDVKEYLDVLSSLRHYEAN